MDNENIVDINEEEMDEQFIEVKLDILLTNQDIDDIMCAALEGGINDWCGKAKVVGKYNCIGNTEKAKNMRRPTANTNQRSKFGKTVLVSTAYKENIIINAKGIPTNSEYLNEAVI